MVKMFFFWYQKLFNRAVALYTIVCRMCICHCTLSTVLSRFLAHAPLSEHAPLLEYRRTEVNRYIYIYIY